MDPGLFQRQKPWDNGQILGSRSHLNMQSALRQSKTFQFTLKAYPGCLCTDPQHYVDAEDLASGILKLGNRHQVSLGSGNISKRATIGC